MWKLERRWNFHSEWSKKLGKTLCNVHMKAAKKGLKVKHLLSIWTLRLPGSQREKTEEHYCFLELVSNQLRISLGSCRWTNAVSRWDRCQGRPSLKSRLQAEWKYLPRLRTSPRTQTGARGENNYARPVCFDLSVSARHRGGTHHFSKKSRQREEGNYSLLPTVQTRTSLWVIVLIVNQVTSV